jgi:hypothetical protein
VLVIFKIGSHELFAWAGFEPQSSRVAGITGMSYWQMAAKFIFKEKRI